MANSIEEIISALYDIVQNAWSLPLGAEKCVLERDKVLDLLDEITSQLPGELKQAKTIVESRNEVITNAKREAETILKQAEQKAEQMVSQEEIYKKAEAESEKMIKAAQQKIKDMKVAAIQFVDKSLATTEDSITAALNEVRANRSSFMALIPKDQPETTGSVIIEEI